MTPDGHAQAIAGAVLLECGCHSWQGVQLGKLQAAVAAAIHDAELQATERVLAHIKTVPVRELVTAILGAEPARIGEYGKQPAAEAEAEAVRARLVKAGEGE